ncbi:N-glycosylase/DNA lyase [Ischnura elegans]|uniref:N-glycosylase/DNA lyase n=1 Tax=Ischnura elegans TaxID=197161 RepID=UPI001ED89A56|nr:N-glycosylase/DNA lyase [Ischnura elegans]
MFQLITWFPPFRSSLCVLRKSTRKFILRQCFTMKNDSWKETPCKQSDIQLKLSLLGGQSFRWKYSEDTGEFTGVFAGRVWKLKHVDDTLFYQTFSDVSTKCIPKKKAKKGSKLIQIPSQESLKVEAEEDILREYLRLDVDLHSLYEEWSARDPHFAEAAKTFYGVRILKQDPIENIFSFICATNNHITRISSMVEKMCSNFGEPIAEVDGTVYYSFPHPSNMVGEGAEKWMRDNGFGYRAKYIRGSAEIVTSSENGQDTWLENLLSLKYEDAKAELTKLSGIGAKVADCICLMSLGHLGAVPVDTHVHQIAIRRYTPHLAKYKTVTHAVYDEIGGFFRNLYGDLAGWAHTILFCADLKMFKDMTDSSKVKKLDTIGNKRKKLKSC